MAGWAVVSNKVVVGGSDATYATYATYALYGDADAFSRMDRA